jgi:hypothetical protein
MSKKNIESPPFNDNVIAFVTTQAEGRAVREFQKTRQ